MFIGLGPYVYSPSLNQLSPLLVGRGSTCQYASMYVIWWQANLWTCVFWFWCVFVLVCVLVFVCVCFSFGVCVFVCMCFVFCVCVFCFLCVCFGFCVCFLYLVWVCFCVCLFWFWCVCILICVCVCVCILCVQKQMLGISTNRRDSYYFCFSRQKNTNVKGVRWHGDGPMARQVLIWDSKDGVWTFTQVYCVLCRGNGLT